MDNTDNPAPENDPQLQRFEFESDGQVIGFIDYYLFSLVVIVTHTEVNSALEGRGNGSRLAQAALSFFGGQGKQVVPVCGFMASFIRKNRKYVDLVTPECQRIFNL